MHMETRTKTKAGYQITPDVSKYLETRLNAIDKLLSGDEAVRYQVELGRSAKHSKKGEDQWLAEIDIKSGKSRWHASADALTLKAAIDAVKDEIIHQIRKDKATKRTAVKKGGQKLKAMVKSGGAKTTKRK